MGLKFSHWTHYGISQAWSTFGHTPLDSHHFLASDWLSRYGIFADKTAHQIQLKFGGWSPYGTPQAKLFLITIHLIPAICWPLIAGIVSTHSQTNGWPDWAKIWWVNLFWYPKPGGPYQYWLTLDDTLLNPSYHFPSLWLPPQDMHPLMLFFSWIAFTWIATLAMEQSPFTKNSTSSVGVRV